jgi:hypothetical protein
MQLKGFVKCFVVGNGITNARGDDNFRWVEDGWPVVWKQNGQTGTNKNKTQNINSNIQDQDDTDSSYLLTKMQTSTTSH